MSATGGLAPEATTFYRKLASLLACKWGDDYSVVMGWLHCSLSFSLLCTSAIAFVRGARASLGHFYRAPPPLDFRVESNIITNFDCFLVYMAGITDDDLILF